MTLWLFVSDVHGRGDRLARVLAAGRDAGVDRIVSLGDTGAGGALQLLREAEALCAFGNWEASGLKGLPREDRNWVGRWPQQMALDGFVAAHASPAWPAGLQIAGVVDHLRANDLHWTHLFPSLHSSPVARSGAFDLLGRLGTRIFFHGHTHLQEAWRMEGEDAPALAAGPVLEVGDGAWWLVGVGSAGDPRDGGGAAYAIYDSALRQVEWRRA
jgi:predicted phosphodiesterase